MAEDYESGKKDNEDQSLIVEIEEISILINNIWSKINNMLDTQFEIVKEGTKVINVSHQIPRKIVEHFVLEAEKHGNKDNHLQTKKTNRFYLDFFPKVETINLFSSLIKSELKANCNGRTVLNPHVNYEGFLPKRGLIKQIYDTNRNMGLVKSVIEHHLGNIFRQEYSLSILINKFIKKNINKRKSMPLNDDVINLIIEYLPGNYILKYSEVAYAFYNERIYVKVCKMIDSIYDDETRSFHSHINDSLFLDDKEITRIRNKFF